MTDSYSDLHRLPVVTVDMIASGPVLGTHPVGLRDADRDIANTRRITAAGGHHAVATRLGPAYRYASSHVLVDALDTIAARAVAA